MAALNYTKSPRALWPDFTRAKSIVPRPHLLTASSLTWLSPFHNLTEFRGTRPSLLPGTLTLWHRSGYSGDNNRGAVDHQDYVQQRWGDRVSKSWTQGQFWNCLWEATATPTACPISSPKGGSAWAWEIESRRSTTRKERVHGIHRIKIGLSQAPDQLQDVKKDGSDTTQMLAQVAGTPQNQAHWFHTAFPGRNFPHPNEDAIFSLEDSEVAQCLLESAGLLHSLGAS